MFEFFYILFIILLFLFLIYNKQNLFTRFIKYQLLIRRKKRIKKYLSIFKENKNINSGNIILQLVPWIAVLIVVFTLSNQYFFFGSVLSGSMEPTFKKGDLVLMQRINTEPEVGDIIIFTVSIFTQSDMLTVTHRVVSINKNGIIRTKGDANPSPDQWDVRKENIIGKAVLIGGKPIVLRGLGGILLPEAGEFTVLTKFTEKMEIQTLYKRISDIEPMMILFFTIFYFFFMMEDRARINRKKQALKKRKLP